VCQVVMLLSRMVAVKLLQVVPTASGLSKRI
jgi:hypothetical protein